MKQLIISVRHKNGKRPSKENPITIGKDDIKLKLKVLN